MIIWIIPQEESKLATAEWKGIKIKQRADQAKEMCDRIYESDSYDKALCIIGEYVNITSVDDGEGEGEGIGSGLSPDDEEPEEDYGMEM